jgi:hypothetical protein
MPDDACSSVAWRHLSCALSRAVRASSLALTSLRSDRRSGVPPTQVADGWGYAAGSPRVALELCIFGPGSAFHTRLASSSSHSSSAVSAPALSGRWRSKARAAASPSPGGCSRGSGDCEPADFALLHGLVLPRGTGQRGRCRCCPAGLGPRGIEPRRHSDMQYGSSDGRGCG